MTFTASPEDPVWHGYVYVAAMFVLSAGQILAMNYYFNRMHISGMRMRTQLCAALYRKSLNLSSSARTKYTSGEIVNLMAVDANRFASVTQFVNLLWSAPFQIIVACYFLYHELGMLSLQS